MTSFLSMLGDVFARTVCEVRGHKLADPFLRTRFGMSFRECMRCRTIFVQHDRNTEVAVSVTEAELRALSAVSVRLNAACEAFR